MADVYAVFLVPSETKMGLLREGPHGARPPTTLWDPSTGRVGGLCESGRGSTQRTVLVLACEGEPVSIGCFLLGEVATDAGGETAGVEALVKMALRGRFDIVKIAKQWGWGAIVFVDEQDNEITP